MNHVELYCLDHPSKRWMCKSIAVSGGRYNGCRNLFYLGEQSSVGRIAAWMLSPGSLAECRCSAGRLRLVPGEVCES